VGGSEVSPVAVLGGTFDPVHLGHLGIARGVLDRTGLSRLWLLPCALPPHKKTPRVSAAHHRLAMLRLAVAGQPGLEICTEEVDRGEVCYTIDTLRRLREASPGLLPAFVMGADSLVELPTWKQFRELIREFTLLVVDRPGAASGTAGLHPIVAAALAEFPGEGAPDWSGDRIYRLKLPPIPISSSEIRARVARGDGLAGLVPPLVARYILDNELYMEEESF
jgi:nicotinate-nucleotide adenylyltransferase